MMYFLVFMFVEVMVSSWFVGHIGGLTTFLELIVSAVAGIYLLQGVKYSLSSKLQSIRQGDIKTKDILKSSLGSGFGAVLLIIPGFFTDIVGILLQFNVVMAIFFGFFVKKQTNFRNFEYNSKHFTKKEKKDEKIIDVEIIDDSRSIGTE